MSGASVSHCDDYIDCDDTMKLQFHKNNFQGPYLQ